MGKRFLRSIVSDFQTLTASADVTPLDLPVNPLSHLLLTLEGTQTTRATAGLYSMLADFHIGVTDLSIRYRGENVIQGSLSDLMMLTSFLNGYFPWGEKPDGDVGKVRTMTFLIPLGRKPFWPEEAFPATTRGTLRFQMTAGALPASFSARRWMLEAIELIEAQPTRHIKTTTISHTPVATGRRRIPLPLGNEILGILLFDPTVVTGDAASYNPHVFKLLKDNVEQYYPQSRWESLHDVYGRRGVIPFQLGGHIHFAGQAIASEVEEPEFNKSEAPRQYNYIDFDPLNDGYYSLETKGAASLDMDLDMDTAAGTSRFLPVELVKN
jgi:hypothetical protein